MTERIENDAVAWVIPGDDHEDCNGFLDAMAYEHGEFTRPLYARATIARLIAEAVAAERERCVSAVQGQIATLETVMGCMKEVGGYSDEIRLADLKVITMQEAIAAIRGQS